MQMPIIIGLVGEKGSGKETVGNLFIKLLPQKKIAHIKFSDLLKETLTLWSLPATRSNLQDLAVIMDKHFGEGTLANALYERINKIKAEIIILDGIRWDADIELINKFPKHYLIYVTANLETRFNRIAKRTEKIGEGKDYDQFLKEEKAANELNIPRLGANADFKIENNTTKLALKKKVQTILNQIFA